MISHTIDLQALNKSWRDKEQDLQQTQATLRGKPSNKLKPAQTKQKIKSHLMHFYKVLDLSAINIISQFLNLN